MNLQGPHRLISKSSSRLWSCVPVFWMASWSLKVAATEKPLSTTQNPLALAVWLSLAHHRPLRGRSSPCNRTPGTSDGWAASSRFSAPNLVERWNILAYLLLTFGDWRSQTFHLDVRTHVIFCLERGPLCCSSFKNIAGKLNHLDSSCLKKSIKWMKNYRNKLIHLRDFLKCILSINILCLAAMHQRHE